VHRREQIFQEGDMLLAYLRKVRYPQGLYNKLKPKKIGPCRITPTKRINKKMNFISHYLKHPHGYVTLEIPHSVKNIQTTID
jgi:hypothetical protein